MDGKALYEKVLAFHPEIRVIYMSGYSGDIIEKNGFLGEGVDFLQKPFTIIGLLDLIRKKLG